MVYSVGCFPGRVSVKIHPRAAPGRYVICVAGLPPGGARGATVAARTQQWAGRTLMIRYGFNIRTRSGQRVDNICIMAASQDDAERRLRQMYHHCEIVQCQSEPVVSRHDPLDVED